MWVFLGLIGLFVLPLLYGFLRDAFGWNRNKFYGDRNPKPTAGDKSIDKSEKYRAQANRRFDNHGGGGGFNG